MSKKRIKMLKHKKFRNNETCFLNKDSMEELNDDKKHEVLLPPAEECEKIIEEMLLKGCYVSELFERFGLEPPED